MTIGSGFTVLFASVSSVGRDRSSTTRGNPSKLAQETKLNPWVTSPGALKSALGPTEPPEGERWRFPLPVKLLEQRNKMDFNLQDCTETSNIDSLCSR